MAETRIDRAGTELKAREVQPPTYTCRPFPKICSKTMIGMRLRSVLLTVALLGPYTMPMLCDCACAVKHQRTEVNVSCHQHATPGTAPTVAAGHLCHDLTSTPVSILTDARQAVFSAPAIVEVPHTLTVESAGDATHQARDVFHTPLRPPLLPLRI